MAQLNGADVAVINSDLSTSADDLSKSKALSENQEVAFEGPKKYGPFEIEGYVAREWLALPKNPNGKSNADVLRPWLNGRDFSDRPSDRWIVDFGVSASAEEAALYEAPFKHVEQNVAPSRATDRNQLTRERWWLFERPRPLLRKKAHPMSRIIVTVRHSKHRLFRLLHKAVMPDTALIAIARDDDTTFGILHSKFHELWSLRMCTWLGVGNDPRYTPTTCFETFPFPEGLTPNIHAAQYAADPRAIAIAKAAARLNDLREKWLNPPDLVQRVAEVVPGYPDRILPVDDKAAAILKNRTLTKLYNERPAWLDHAHKDLDSAVAAAYGWKNDLTDEQILEKLFALNQERAAKQ